MKTTSIHIEGQIISPEIFDRLESNEIIGQLPQDFGFDKRVRVKDEIATAWANAKDQWNIFKRNIEKLKDEESGTTETRRYWITPLLGFLGFDLSLAKAEEVNGNSFAISHRDKNLDGFPVHIVGVNDSLDKRRETGGPRLSPHALLQEYLNITEHDYGLVTNGYQLRLLRDSGKLIRLTYLEFDLLQMMEDDLFAEFSIMFRLIHSSRMPKKYGEGDESIIEQYHQLSLEAGARIREKLSSAVEKSIITVANGFLKHPANDELRDKIRSKEIRDDRFYNYLLRFIYRVLFLMVLEERNIVYPNKRDEKSEYLHDVYFNYYSISRIRKLSENIFFFDEKLEDLWIALRNTFKIFSDERLATKLGIYPLNGDLFDYGSIGVLSESNLDNHTLLECIRNLSLFENPETKSIIRVNYAALNVEEFGSVYEGLLEQKPTIYDDGHEIRFGFEKGTERSSSGSHYTPEELVQPLVKHSLDYVIEEKLKNVIASLSAVKAGGAKQSPQDGQIASSKTPRNDEIIKAKEQALLSIKVCDVACGSGHILLSAARRIAQELTKVRTGEDQPSPEPYRHAIRDVINHCIYGVDKNPLAVELCKVALWLEAHNPGMPLNFLDHKIKCGDSIVGLARIEELQNGIATEAFKTLPGDDKDIAASFRKRNKTERENRAQLRLTDTEEIINNLNTISVKFKSFNLLPDTTVDEVKKKQQEYNLLKGSDWMKLKELADIQTAQFFIDKTNANKEFLTTDAEYFRIFAGQKKEVNTRKISKAMATAVEKKFFHWFLEFPEVMQEGGFDCILGNPPFLGGSKISGSFGNDYLNYIKLIYTPAEGLTDLVAYFFRRNFELLNDNKFLALLSTNSLYQGDSRATSLDVIDKNGGEINFAIRSIRWPGVAKLFISIICICKGKFSDVKFLDNKLVDNISPYLDSGSSSIPFKLPENQSKCFIGSSLLGTGFMISHSEANYLKKYEIDEKIIFPCYSGDDLNNNFDLAPSRSVIYFRNWDFDSANKYPDLLKILEERVLPKRMKSKQSQYIEKWWLFKRPTLDLYDSVQGKKQYLATALTTRFLNFIFINDLCVFTHAAGVVASERISDFTLLQSTFHSEWAFKQGSSLATTLRYTPSDCFETFPFPQTLTTKTESELEKIGEEYHEFRRQLMLDMQLGLTKTYNLFHNPEVRSQKTEEAKNIKEFKQAKLQIPIEEAIQRIEKLRTLHKQMDEAVLKAYGWGLDSAQPENVIAIPTGREKQSQPPIDLEHNFYEVDYLPENDRVRYTISPEARKEILKRLLELNHKIHAEEVAKGLWEKGKSKKNKTSVVKEQQEKYGQGGLFGE